MNCWFARNLGDAMLAGEPLEHIKELFLAEYATGNSSKELGLIHSPRIRGTSAL